MLQCSPINAKVNWRPLISRRKKSFSKLIASTNSVKVVHVVQHNVMEPQAGICICICPIWILKSSFHVGDGAVLASKFDTWILEVLHAIIDVH